MVGLLDVFDQLIQTPLKLIEREGTERRKNRGKHTHRRIKVHGAGEMKGMWEARRPQH